MTYQLLPESHLTLYAELLDQSIQVAASAAATGVPLGSFISKKIKGRTYWYLQQSHGEEKHQTYLGPDSPALNRWMDEARASAGEIRTDRLSLVRLSKMLVTGGAVHEPAAVLKALQLLADSRVFQLGGVLVGTLAFRLFANALGVKFERSALQTQDLDIAHDPAIGVALARESETVDLDRSIGSSEMGFQPVPPLDPRRPSTSFRFRGRDLRIDFVTPMLGPESQEPVFLPAFGLSAQPLRHLGYLLDPTIQAVALGSAPVLVNLPDPARFAVHKLWLSTRRPATFQTKARKDLAQANQLIEVLLVDRPDDILEAWAALPTESARSRVKQAASHLDPPIRAGFEEVSGLT